jgi:hypothetical protein
MAGPKSPLLLFVSKLDEDEVTFFLNAGDDESSLRYLAKVARIRRLKTRALSTLNLRWHRKFVMESKIEQSSL